MKQKFKEVENLLLTGDANTVSGLKCPSCGSKLTAIFTDDAGRRSLGIRCASSCYRTNIDGLALEPPWVAVVGKRLETT